jgi:hypothetical protein
MQFGLSDKICCLECLFEISAVLPGKKKEVVLNIIPDRLLTTQTCLKFKVTWTIPSTGDHELILRGNIFSFSQTRQLNSVHSWYEMFFLWDKILSLTLYFIQVPIFF